MTTTADHLDTENGNPGRLDTLLRTIATIGPGIAAAAARRDREGSLAAEGITAVRDAGLLAMAVPVELGGLGASLREVTMTQRALARHCGSTALATAMHQHSVYAAAWRYRHGDPDAAAMLRRVAEERLIIVTTGGADFTQPRGAARKVRGGYRVSGRKVFCSLSSAGNLLSTLFPVTDHEPLCVIGVALPLDTEGIVIADNWDTLGMRATASNDILLDDVFVPDDAVGPIRPHGVIDAPLQVVIAIATPIIAGVYLGIAEAASDAALEAAMPKRADPLVQRQAGLMVQHLTVAEWTLDGALDAVGDDPQPSPECVAAVNAAKREVAQAGVEICDVAMELAGGAAFYRGSVIERCYRDIRAAKFHPLTPEKSLRYSGRIALGLPPDGP